MAFFLPVPFSPSEECCTLISRRILKVLSGKLILIHFSLEKKLTSGFGINYTFPIGTGILPPN